MVRASLISLLTAAFLVGCGGSDEAETPPEPAVTGPLDEKGSDLFVLRGPAEVADGRIEVTTDVVEWFNDRPQRNAGVANAEELVEKWEGYGFAEVPPNAALAGQETDAEVELTKPRITPDGLSFAYKSLRGDVASEDDAMSVFIDSSDWETDMHVYVKATPEEQYNTVGWCENNVEWSDSQNAANLTTVLENPVINTAPDNWSYPPQDQVALTQSNQEIFTAASKSGTTSFKVTYEVWCTAGNLVGQAGYVTFSGKVPDSLSSDSFSCTVGQIVMNNPPDDFKCSDSNVSGYHVDAYAALSFIQEE